METLRHVRPQLHRLGCVEHPCPRGRAGARGRMCPEHTGHFRLLPDGQVSRGVDDTPRARGASGNRQSPPAMWDGIL